MNVAEIKRQITAAIKKAKQEQKELQIKCDENARFIKRSKSKEQLLKNYKLKLELIKGELEKNKDDFKLSIHVDKNFRVKAFKKIKGLQLEVHLDTEEDSSKTITQIQKEFIEDEDIMRYARKSIRKNLDAKFTEQNLEKYFEKEIKNLDTAPDGNLFFDSDTDEFWYDYDEEIEKQVKNPKLREDNITEFHGVIRRNINKDKEYYRDSLKALAELKSGFDKEEAQLQEKTNELNELQNELKYLDQIEKKYL